MWMLRALWLVVAHDLLEFICYRRSVMPYLHLLRILFSDFHLTQFYCTMTSVYYYYQTFSGCNILWTKERLIYKIHKWPSSGIKMLKMS